MPVMRGTSYRMVSGTANIATINAATPIKSWTLQSDQNIVYRWFPPEDPARGALDTRVFRRPVQAQYQDFSLRAHGYYTAQWPFTFWTEAQLVYFRSQMLSGGVLYATVSVMGYKSNYVTPQYMLCTVYDPEYIEGGLTYMPGGYRVVLKLDKGVEIVA